MSIILYGIKNCDAIKKAQRWLETQQIEYTFHDFRVDGLTKDMLKEFLKHVDWETLLNKRGTTWRKLSDDIKNSIDETSSIQVMLDNPSAIKRPILENGKTLLVGFKEEEYKILL